jgi:2-polyprenyl-6-methoxyphenol hydroxylase-like FAD-dependent oxidoreductase
MPRLNVLISGAGIAGCTLAYWLARNGHRATVVERSGTLRSSGSPVDVRDPATNVVAQMGIVPRLEAARTRVAGLAFLDDRGRQAVRVDLEAMRRAIDPRHIELPRGDLASLLYEAARDSAEFIFADTIMSLDQTGGEGVDVAFERGPARRFDLVVGADGLHSVVRRLTFGSEENFLRYAGLYVATLPVPPSVNPGRDILMLNAPGKSLTLHPSRGRPLAALIFWSPEIEGLDHADGARHKDILERTYAGLGWQVPEVLAEVQASSDLYFDSVSRVQLSDWSKGRVALVGDAASCVSLFGDGSTLAIAGAYELAAALAEDSANPEAAFRRYREKHNRLVAPKSRNVRLLASIIVPRTRAGIYVRNRMLGLVSTYAALKQMMRRAGR